MAFAVFSGASLQAADAPQHLVLPALLDFLGHLRVRQRGPGHGDQIGLAGLQNALRHLDIVDAAHGNHRDMHRALDGGGVLHIGAPGHHRGRDDVLGGGVHPLGAVDAVGPGLFHHAGQHLGLLYLQAAGDVLHGAHPVEHGEIRPAFLFDVPDDFHRKPRPVLDGAAVLVAALVGKGRGESPHQVAVGPVDLHPVKAGLLGPAGAVSKLLHQLVDFLHRQLPGRFRHGGLPDGRGAHRPLPGDGAAGLPARVVNLDHNLSACLVDPAGQLLMGLDLAAFPQSRQPCKSPGLGGDGVVLGDDEPPAAPGLVLVVGQVFLCGGAVGIAVVCHHGGNHQAVFQLQLANAEGFKGFHVWSLLVGISLSPAYHTTEKRSPSQEGKRLFFSQIFPQARRAVGQQLFIIQYGELFPGGGQHFFLF